MRIVLLSKRQALMLILCIIVLAAVLSLGGQSRSVISMYKIPGTFYMVNTQDKVIALTFDDGPDPLTTGPILDILKQQKVKATFFVLGQAARENPGLLSRMKKEGHEIGNHGYTHDYLQTKLVKELAETDEAVFGVTGVHTHFYRPPGGRVTRNQIDMVKHNGHVVALWSLDSRDWLNPGSKRIIRNVTQAAFPGAIVLLHDGGDKRVQTVDALEAIIQDLRGKGYRFVTLSELQEFAKKDDKIPTATPN